MATEIFIRQNILVYIKLHTVFRIVHKTEHGHAAGCHAEKSLHIFRRCKTQAGTAYQTRKILCREALVACHQQEIKLRFAAVAEKKVFAHICLQESVDFFAGFYCGRDVVVKSAVIYAESVKHIVYGDFGRNSSGSVIGAPAI